MECNMCGKDSDIIDSTCCSSCFAIFIAPQRLIQRVLNQPLSDKHLIAKKTTIKQQAKLKEQDG